jgi:hypothetical protein
MKAFKHSRNVSAWMAGTRPAMTAFQAWLLQYVKANPDGVVETVIARARENRGAQNQGVRHG